MITLGLHDKLACEEPITIKNFVINTIVCEIVSHQTPVQQLGVFTAIFCGVLGPGILLMLTREKPLSEH